MAVGYSEDMTHTRIEHQNFGLYLRAMMEAKQAGHVLVLGEEPDDKNLGFMDKQAGEHHLLSLQELVTGFWGGWGQRNQEANIVAFLKAHGLMKKAKMFREHFISPESRQALCDWPLGGGGV